MRMLDFLHKAYPKVHISLHAGELAAGLVPPEDLRFHIRESIEQGHAERIGHGVSVMNERDPLALLKEMAARNVLVEICLTSNAKILEVEGANHPLATYMKYGVPVALASDDEGVSRSDMTQEYLRAVETQGLSYIELKRMARQSLEHSFISGESLWRKPSQMVTSCATESNGGKKFARMPEVSRCQRKSPRAMETGKRVQAIRRGLLTAEESGVMPNVKGIWIERVSNCREPDLKGHRFRRSEQL